MGWCFGVLLSSSVFWGLFVLMRLAFSGIIKCWAVIFLRILGSWYA